jgi:hypothetical protein
MRDVAMIRAVLRRRLLSALSHEARLLHDMKIGEGDRHVSRLRSRRDF